jgi:hypothetical protein
MKIRSASAYTLNLCLHIHLDVLEVMKSETHWVPRTTNPNNFVQIQNALATHKYNDGRFSLNGLHVEVQLIELACCTVGDFAHLFRRYQGEYPYSMNSTWSQESLTILPSQIEVFCEATPKAAEVGEWHEKGTKQTS